MRNMTVISLRSTGPSILPVISNQTQSHQLDLLMKSSMPISREGIPVANGISARRRSRTCEGPQNPRPPFATGAEQSVVVKAACVIAGAAMISRKATERAKLEGV